MITTTTLIYIKTNDEIKRLSNMKTTTEILTFLE